MMGDTWHIIMKRDALASMLKDVQKNCIDLEQENERLREALRKWDALIQYQYNGSREAMSALQECAFETDAILKGYALEEKSDD